MAANAGIAQEATGDVWWSVNTTVLTNSEIASVPPRKLTIVRFPGIPENIYITGAASEGGATLGNALPFKRTTVGVFEIYTRLTAGNSYYFVTANSGTPRQFSIAGETSIVEGGSTPSSETAIYKIVLDFNTDQATFTKITGMGIWPCSDQTVKIPLNYAGNGVWSVTDYTVTSANSDWGNARYKILMTTGSGNVFWGTVNSTDSPPGGNPNPNYYFMKIVTSGQWDDKWKIPSEFAGGIFDASVTLNASGEYTHMITRK
jgi:hypothetical protein